MCWWFGRTKIDNSTAGQLVIMFGSAKLPAQPEDGGQI